MFKHVCFRKSFKVVNKEGVILSTPSEVEGATWPEGFSMLTNSGHLLVKDVEIANNSKFLTTSGLLNEVKLNLIANIESEDIVTGVKVSSSVMGIPFFVEMDVEPFNELDYNLYLLNDYLDDVEIQLEDREDMLWSEFLELAKEHIEVDEGSTIGKTLERMGMRFTPDYHKQYPTGDVDATSK